jgi:hypothetical protein
MTAAVGWSFLQAALIRILSPAEVVEEIEG